MHIEIIERPLIYLIGDSITQYGTKTSQSGWGSLLIEYYEGKADVINRGVSGYTSQMLISIVDQLTTNNNKSNISGVIVCGG
jgi:lysophospholipase L1-like esterase